MVIPAQSIMHQLLQLTLLLCLLLGTLSPPVTGLHEIEGSALYDEVAAKFLPLERWLQQRSEHSCLSDTRADVLFAVDGSESVSLTDFHLVVKSLLVDTIGRLQIGENFVQVGVLVFSAQVSQVIPIGKFADKLDLLRAVSRLTHDGGFTAMDAAVEGCIAELGRRRVAASILGEDRHQDHPDHQDRQDHQEERKRIVVFVTDGRHSEASFGGVYLRHLLGRLHRRVTAALAVGLRNSEQPALLELATEPGLAFDPTAYPDYQLALHRLLNMRCSGACYKYEQQRANARKVLATLVQYVNYLIANFASYRKQQTALVDYAKSLNASAAGLEADIERTCNAEDNGLLRRIVTLQERIRTETNGSNFAGASVDAYAGEMIRKISAVQEELFDDGQRLAAEKAKLAGTELEEERLRADFQARLQSKQAVRKAQQESLAALEARIATYRKEMLSVAKSIGGFENVSAELSDRVRRQEAVYTGRQAQLASLTQEHALLTAVQRGGQSQLAGMSSKLALCQAHLRDGHTVLFAVRCGSGASFESLFSRDDASFSEEEAFNGLSDQRPVYKSPYLRRLHAMGYFSSVTWQFLDSNGSQLIGSITMDTSRFELSSLFSRARVITSFPWVASYINSIYSASLPSFRHRPEDEFLLAFGDLSRYRVSGSCSDIVGVFLVLGAPHRCYPEAATFPQVYVSVSPFGGPISVAVGQLRLITDRLPADHPSPLAGAASAGNGRDQLTEVLLYAKAGAGYLHSLLLTSRYTPAALLAEVDDLSQLARHYKSSLLASLNLDNYRAIRLELFDRSGSVLAALRFKGPFVRESVNNNNNNSNNNNNNNNSSSSTSTSTSLHGGNHNAIGANPDSWSWFQARYLDSATPFDLRRLRTAARFEFYNGVEFFLIGEHLAEGCSERSYYLALADGDSACRCFPGAGDTPAIYFADEQRALTCGQLTPADSLRLTGELVGPRRRSADTAVEA